MSVIGPCLVGTDDGAFRGFLDGSLLDCMDQTYIYFHLLSQGATIGCIDIPLPRGGTLCSSEE